MQCPSSEVLRAFVLGEPYPNADAIDAHVESCASCRRIVDGVYEEGDEALQEYLRAQGAENAAT